MKCSFFYRYFQHSIIIIASLYGVFVYSMNEEPSLKDNNTIVFELIQKHGSISNHHDICALALVNKFWNNYIKSTADDRKQYFSASSKFHKNRPHLVWHPNGSAYAYAYFCSKDKTRYLHMRYHYLLDKNYLFSHEADWGNNAFSLLSAPNIYFTQNGDACFYATGMINVLGHGRQREVIEYMIDSRGKRKKTRCVLGTKDNNGEFVSISLAQFARHSFPSLTRAVLNSRNVSELTTPWHKDTVKVFHWEGVDVPRHYRNHKETSTISLTALRGKTYPNAHDTKNQ